jgi:putative transposase
MSYIRIWIHLVFATKNREPLLTKDIRYKVQEHIIENRKEKSIYLQAINGYTEHIHCLISLGKEQSIAKVAQLIKGESLFWINKHQLTEHNLCGKMIILQFLLANQTYKLWLVILESRNPSR